MYSIGTIDLKNYLIVALDSIHRELKPKQSMK